MLLKKKLLNACKLYLILDTQVKDYDQLFWVAKKAISAGVDIIQLRDKSGCAKDVLRFSQRMLRLTQDRIPYIINDRVDLVKATGASGVHLGQNDLSFSFARKMLGKKAIIGISAQTHAHAKKAQSQGADYVGFGSVFKTKTKPGRCPMNLSLLKKVNASITIPVFAIGGITLENYVRVQSLGVKRIAICRALCESKNVEADARRFVKEDELNPELNTSKILDIHRVF